MTSRLINRTFAMSVRRLIKDSFFATAATQETTEITDLRVKFTIEKHLGNEPNKCEVSVYNLSKDSRAAFQKRPLQVRLDAGYDGERKLLFRGDLRYGISGREGPDWVTKLQLGDGDRAYNEARVSTAFRGGALPRDAVKDLAKALGLTLSDSLLAGFTSLATPFSHGITLHGPVRDELTRLLRPHHLDWSIQDGALQVIPEQGTRSNEALLVDGDAGLIGSPEYGAPQKKGAPPTLNVRVLLYPRVLPGSLVRVQSLTVSGTFRAETVRHEGDTHGDDWTTTLELKPL